MERRYTRSLVRPDGMAQNAQNSAHGSSPAPHAGNTHGNNTHHGNIPHLAQRLRQCAAGLLFFFTALILSAPSSVYAQLPGQTGYQGEGPNARMRIGFELRQVSAEDANKIIKGQVGGYDADNRWGDHYIDLWTYAYFDVATFSKYAVYSSISRKYSWKLIPVSNSIAYVLQKDRAGTTDVAMTNARIAPASPATAGSELAQAPLADLTYLSDFDYGNPRDYNGGDWKGYGMHSSSSGKQMSDYNEFVDTVTLEDGVEYFRVKMFMVRFEWKKLGPFYANFVCGNKEEDWSGGVTNWNLQNADNKANAYLCDKGTQTEKDFVIAAGKNSEVQSAVGICGYSDESLKFRQGGVEIISGFQASLTPKVQTLCPGSEAKDTLRIAGYKSSDMDWSKVECYLERYDPTDPGADAKGWTGTTKVISGASSDKPYFGTTDGPTSNAVSTQNPLKVPLFVPYGWHKNTYDSLRLNVIAGDTTANFPFKLNFTKAPYPLKFAVSKKEVVSNPSQLAGALSDIVNKKAGGTSGVDTIVLTAEDEVFPRILTSYPSGTTAAADNMKFIGGCGTDFTKIQVFYQDGNKPFEEIGSLAVSVTGSQNRYHMWHSGILSGTNLKAGKYFIHVTINGCAGGLAANIQGCEYNTDTVYIKVPKILPPPVITLNITPCERPTEMKLTAATDQTGITQWEWAIGTNAAEDFNDKVKRDGTAKPQDAPLHVVLKDNKDFVAWGEELPDEWDQSLEYKTYSSGSTANFEAIYDQSKWSDTKYILCFNAKQDDSNPDADFMGGVDAGVWPNIDDPAVDKDASSYTQETNPAFLNSVFFARYHTNEGISQWAIYSRICDYADAYEEAAGSFGISVTSCLSSLANTTAYPNMNPATCKEKDTSVNVGSEVTFRAFVSFGKVLNEELIDDYGYLSDVKLSVNWQYSTDDGLNWTTWHVSGVAGGADMGMITETKVNVGASTLRIPTLTAKRTIIQPERHRITLTYHTPEYDCEYPAEWNTDENDNYSNCIFEGVLYDATKNKYGFYDDEVTVFVQTEKPQLYVAKTGQEVNKKKDTICNGGTVDLNLKAKLTNTSKLTWQYSTDKATWNTVLGTTVDESYTSISHNEITPVLASGADFLTAGGTVYYRVKVVDGTETSFSDTVEVKVYKAAKVYIYSENDEGVYKSETAGYCFGDKIYTMPVKKDGTHYASLPAGVQKYHYQDVANVNGFEDPSSVGTTANKQAYTPTAGTRHYRIVTENHGCYEYSDTAHIKINPQVTATVTFPTERICAGTKATLQAGGTPQPLTKYIWGYYGDKNDEDRLMTEVTTDPTFSSLTFPMIIEPDQTDGESVALITAKTFGKDLTQTPIATEDTITCYSAKDMDDANWDAEIRTKTCRPELVIWGEEEICAGASDTLGWIDPHNSEKFLCGTDDKLYYAPEPYASYQEVPSTDYTCEQHIEDGDEYTWIILKGTSVVTSTPGKYKFKAAKDGKTESEPTVVLTVMGKPTFTLSMGLDHEALCEDATDGVKGTATATFTNGSSGNYTYIWYKDNVEMANTGPTASYQFVPANADNAINSTHEGEYEVRAVLKNSAGCVSDTVKASKTFTMNPKPTPAKVTMGSDVTACENTTATLTATVDPAATVEGGTITKNTYIWYGPGKNGEVTSDATLTLTGVTSTANGGDYYMRVISETNKGCKDTSAIPAAKLQLSVVQCDDPTIDSVKACPEATADKTFKLTCPPSATGITFPNNDLVFVDPSAFTAGTQNYTIKPKTTPTSTTTYEVTVTMPGGKTKTLKPEFEIYPSPEATSWKINGKEATEAVYVCAGDSVKVTATVDGTNIAKVTEYKWIMLNRSYEEKTGNNTYLTASATQGDLKESVQLVMQLESDKGCTASTGGPFFLQTVGVPAKPTIDPMPAQDVCANVDDTIRPTVTAAPNMGAGVNTTTYTWYYTTGGSNPTTGSQSFTGKDLILCSGGCTTDKGVNMPTSGTIKARLYINSTYTRDGHSCSIDSMGPVVTINVNPEPSSSASDKTITACPNMDTTLSPGVSLATGESITYYKWEYDGGTVKEGATANTYKVENVNSDAGTTNTGDYTVTMTVKNTASGCTKDIVSKITVNAGTKPVFSASLTLDNATLCEGDKTGVKATAGPTDGGGNTYTYTWYKGSDKIDGATSNTYQIVNAGTAVALSDADTYKVSVVMKNAAGCLSDPKEKTATLTVKAKPKTPNYMIVSVTPKPWPNGELCEDATGDGTDIWMYVRVAATTAGAEYTYIYMKDGVEKERHTITQTEDYYRFVDNATPIQLSDSGYYWIYTLATKDGCVSDTGKNTKLHVTVNPAPKFTVAVNSEAACPGGEVTFTATPTLAADNQATLASTPYTYAWEAPAGTSLATTAASHTFTVVTTSPTSYKATVTATSNKSCTATASGTGTLTIKPKAVITVNPNRIQIAKDGFCPGEKVEMSVTASVNDGSLSYQWQKDGTDIDGATGSGYTIAQAQKEIADDGGKYSVVITNIGATCPADAVTLDTSIEVYPMVYTEGVDVRPNDVLNVCKDSLALLEGVRWHNARPGDVWDYVVKVTYKWYAGGVLKASEGPQSISTGDICTTYKPVTSTVGTVKHWFWAIYTSEKGCMDSVKSNEVDVTVHVCAPPTLQSKSVCPMPASAPQAMTFTYSTPKPTTITWYVKKPGESAFVAATGTDNLNGSYASVAGGSFTPAVADLDKSAAGTTTVFKMVLDEGAATERVAYGNYIIYPNPARLDITGIKISSGGSVVDTAVYCEDANINLIPTYANNGSFERVEGHAWKLGDILLGNASTYTTQIALSDGGKYYYSARGVTSQGCYDTVTDKDSIYIKVMPKPVLTSLLDGDGNTESAICASETTYPKLKATLAAGKIIRWERKVGTGSWQRVAQDPVADELQITDALISKPASTGSAIVNFFRVVIGNTNCDDVESDPPYKFTVNPSPVIHRMEVTPADREVCGNLTLTAKAYKDATTSNPYTGTGYKWEKWDNNAWVSAGTGTTKALTAPDENTYRCVFETGINTCKAYDTVKDIKVLLSAPTEPGTVTLSANEVCSSASSLPSVSLSGNQTGSLVKWTFTCGSNTVTKEDADATSPYTLTTADINSLITSTANALRIQEISVKATIRNGSKCDEKTTPPVTLTVYRPVPEIALETADKIWCVLPGSVTLKLQDGDGKALTSQALSSAEKIKWERIGTASSVSSEPGTMDLLAATSTALTQQFNTNYYPYPKQNADTAYWFRATLSSTGCSETKTAAVKQIVLRQSSKPALNSKPGAVCEGSQYEVSAKRVASATALVWKEVIDGTETLITSGITESNGVETLTVSSAEKGTHTYKVYDVRPAKGDCSETLSSPLEITVSVDEKPVANTLTYSPVKTTYCHGDEVTFTAGYTPSDATLTWWLVRLDAGGNATTDTVKGSGNNWKQALAAQSGQTSTKWKVNYMLTSSGACGTVYKYNTLADYNELTVVPAPKVTLAASPTPICSDDEVTLTLSDYGKSVSYRLYVKEGSADAVEITSGATNFPTDGSAVTVKHRPTVLASSALNKTFTYYAEAIAEGGGCAAATSPQKSVLVHAKPIGGKLEFTNPVTPSEKEVDVNVGNSGSLSLSGSYGTRDWEKVSYQGENTPGAFASAGLGTTATNNYSFSPSDIAVTLFRVRVSNGTCPDAYSDTVKANVSASDKPTLAYAGNANICITEAPKMEVVVPDGYDDQMTWANVAFEYRGPRNSDDSWPAWASVTPVSPTSFSATDKEATMPLVAAKGVYEYRYNYTYMGVAGMSNSISYTIDEKSDAGTLSVANPVVCENSADAPEITVSDRIGNTVTWKYSATAASWGNPSHAGNADKLTLSNPQVSDSGWYKITVQNGACPAVSSDSVLVRVHSAPKKPTLTPQNVCLGWTATVTLTRGAGDFSDSIMWQGAPWTATQPADGDFSNLDKNPAYINNPQIVLGPLEAPRWLRVAVNSKENICASAISDPVKIGVYDTLKITNFSKENNVIKSGSNAVFTVTVVNAGNTGYEPVSVGSYRWEFTTNNGASWEACTIGDDFAGVNTSSLTVKKPEDYIADGTYFRCEIEDNRNCFTIRTVKGKIVVQENLDPGKTVSLTASNCYYINDSAFYEVRNAVGEGALRYYWQVQIGSDWNYLTDLNPALTAKIDSNRIAFGNIHDLVGYSGGQILSIRACVLDETMGTDASQCGEGTYSTPVEVCEVDPRLNYKGDSTVVCENTNVALNIESLGKGDAMDKHNVVIRNRMEFAYKAKGETAFTPITATPSTINLADGKTVQVTIDTAGRSDARLLLGVIRLTNAPYEADSMIFEVKMYSNFSVGLDTTVYAMVRVDRPVTIATAAPDTTVCEGQDYGFLTEIKRGNPTLITKLTGQWTNPQGGKPAASITWARPDSAFVNYTGTNASDENNGTWTLSLTGEYCTTPVTDQVELTVLKTPTLENLVVTSVACAGSEITLTATVDRKDASTVAPYTITWERRDRNGQWRDVLGDAWTATDSIATSVENGTGTQKLHKLVLKKGSPADAGRYRAVLNVTGACATTDSREVDVKVNMKPEVTSLSRGPVVPVTVGNPAAVTVNYKSEADLAAQYNVENGYIVIPTPTYKWMFKKPDDADYTQAVNNSANPFAPLVKGGWLTQTINLVGADGFSGTYFYAQMENGCGSSRSTDDTVIISDRFSITEATASATHTQPACQGEDVVLTISTTAAAAYVEWHVTLDNGATWIPLAPIPSLEYDSSWRADNTYTLTVKKVTALMEGHMYRAVVHDDATPPVWDTVKNGLEENLRLHIDKAVSLTCDDADVFDRDFKQSAVVVGGSPDRSDFRFDIGCASGACIGSDHDCDLTYVYEMRKPVEGVLPDGYTQVSTDRNYTFEPALADTGMNYLLFRVGNHCGWDTAYDSVLVLKVINPGPITAIERLPEPDPEGYYPDPKQEIVQTTPIDITVCDSNFVWFEGTFEPTPDASFRTYWERSTDDGANWSEITTGDVFSYSGDSLIIKPVSIAASMNGNKFRRVLDMPGKVVDVKSPEFTLNINALPTQSPFSLTIRDGGDDAMQDGDVRDQHQVVFHIYDTVSGAGGGAGYNKLCVMRRVTKDSVAEVICQTGGPFTFPLEIPSFTANVEDHDSTLYFVKAYNDCGKVVSDIKLLRVYDTLIVRWIADTIIYTEAGDEWSVDSLGEIVPGRLIDVYSAFDSVPLQAHVFLCDSTFIIFNDTTLKGFMNPVDEEEENTHSSRWWMRSSEDEEWDFVDPYDWTSRNTEHKGSVGTVSEGFFTLDNNGMQIKGWGVNNLYCDSTSVLTVHVLPRLEENDLKMNPSEISLCESAPSNDQTFEVTSTRYTGELWELAAEAYKLQWQYRTPEGETWVTVDTNEGRTSWHFGAVKAEHDGWRVRAFASVPCGSDTVEAVIHVTPSVAPQVLLVSDSACLGDELVFTATTENMGENPVFEWFVDDKKDEAATGAEYRTSALTAGEHTITVRATLTDATLCVSPDNASDSKVAVVYALPQIKADIADTVMKNIDTTSVWVKGQGDYTYEWTPKTGLLDAKSDSTLLWGLEPQQEPYWYKVTATDEHNCQAKDSVHVRIESNFTIDSFSIVVVVPPALDLDDGRLPGYPDEPDKAYYPDLDVTPFGGELIFRDDTVADLWICAHNTALIHFNVRGGEEPITYTWTIDDGNATLVYPVDAKEGSAYSFTEPDSVFGVFFPDTTTHTMYCDIKDKTGVGGKITIRVHYYRPEMFYLEVTPKVTSGKYYEQQAMNFFVRPDRDWLTTWIVIRDGDVEDTVTNRKMNRQMSFTKEEGDETSVWISTVDRHGCRIWDSVPIHIIPLPNVLLLGDPMYGVIFPEFEVEVTNTWGLKVKAFEDRNGNGSSRGWDGRTKSGTYVVAGTYYYRAKVPTLDKKGYMIVNGAVTVVNK